MIKSAYSVLDSVILVSSIFFFVKLMAPRVPLADFLRQVRDRLPQPGYLLCLFFAFVASLIDYTETHYDARVTHYIQKDYTPFVARFGTHWVANIQRYRDWPLTYIFTYTYIWAFPAMMFALFFVFVYENREEMAQFLVGCYFSNLLFVLPFYLFFPVDEVWTTAPHVRLLTDQISPLIMQHFRSTSALDNCFPSFHTSLALLIAISAWRMKTPRIRIMAAIFVALVVSSTLYLGVHWPLDVLGGVVTAVACASLSYSAAPSFFARAEMWFEELRQATVGKIFI